MATCYNELLLFIVFLSYIMWYLHIFYAALSFLKAGNVKAAPITQGKYVR